MYKVVIGMENGIVFVKKNVIVDVVVKDLIVE